VVNLPELGIASENYPAVERVVKSLRSEGLQIKLIK